MKAIALISGGLDSILAAKVMQEQGIEVIPLHFKIPFCHYGKEDLKGAESLSILVKENLNLELKQVDIREEFLRLLKDPEHGFGSNMNPCIDCKILMLKKAKELMREWQASFAVTGEVLGQRPMSQHRQALLRIETKSGLEGLLLRPLSARLLEESLPEKEGWVKRESLLAFSGRTRRPQIELANKLSVNNYPNAAGGCLLTDPEFSKRLKDLIKYNELSIDNIELLRWGRYFRISSNSKLIVGRNQREDIELEKTAKDNDYLFYPDEELAGPTSLARGVFDKELLELCCRITSRYCDLEGSPDAEIIYRKMPEKEEVRLKCAPLEEDKLVSLRL